MADVIPSGGGLRTVVLSMCEACIGGAGGECHTPGCALYMNRAPDVPLAVVLGVVAALPERERMAIADALTVVLEDDAVLGRLMPDNRAAAFELRDRIDVTL